MHNFQWSSPLGCGSHIIQGKITCITLTDQFEMSVMVVIARFKRKFCLMSGREVDTDGKSINNIRSTLTTIFI